MFHCVTHADDDGTEMWQILYEIWRSVFELIQGLIIGFLVIVASFLFSVVITELIGVENQNNNTKRNNRNNRNH